jgi:alkaline phosphatase D
LSENPLRLWRSWRWGDTAEFFAIDVRSERKPSTLLTPDAQYISIEQMAWLKQGLTDSPATFKLILNSVPIMEMPPIWGEGWDRWEAYNPQRTELIDFLLESNIHNVYFITGDFHMATVGRLDPPGGPGYGFWEFMLGPGAQANPLGNREGIIEVLGEENDPLPPNQFLWGYHTRVASFVDLDPFTTPPQLTVRYYDEEGTSLFQVTFADGQIVDTDSGN